MKQFRGFWFRVVQEWVDMVDLYPIPRPIVLDFKPTIISARRERHCHVYGNITAASDDRGISKVQNAAGLVTIFIGNSTFSLSGAGEIVLTTAKNPLWAGSGFCQGPWLFPQYMIFVVRRGTLLATDALEGKIVAGTFMRWSAAFFISFHKGSYPGRCHMYCSTCIETWHKFLCTHPKEMLRKLELALAKGRGLQWVFTNQVYRQWPRQLRLGCNFWSSKCSTEDKRLMAYELLAQPFNLTDVPSYSSTAVVSEYGDDSFNPHLDMSEMVGYRFEFKFITSDGVYGDVQVGIWAPIWRPFLPSVWALLLLSLAAFSLANCCINLPYEHNHADCLLLMEMAQYSCQLIGKSIAVVQKRLHPWGGTASAALAVTWVISMLVLTSFYSAMYSANYIAAPNYRTNWTYLEQLENFSYEGISDDVEYFLNEPLEGLVPSNNTGLGYMLNHLGEARFKCRGGDWRRSRSEPCGMLIEELGTFFLEADDTIVAKDLKRLQWARNHRRMLTNMINRAKFFDLANGEETYAEHLLRPQTAVVMAKESFQEDWKVFERLTSKTGRRFGHNLHVYDGLFRRMTAVMTATKFGKEHGTIMEKRLRGLTQSGIYSLWQRWESHRKEHQLEKKQALEIMTEEGGLDFENSEIGVAFNGFVLGIAISDTMFLGEIIRYCYD